MARKLRGDEKVMSSSSSKDLVVVVAGGCSLVTRDPTPPPLLVLLPPPLLLSRFGKTGLGAIGGGGACPTKPGGSPSDSEPESVVSSRCMVSTRLLPFPFPFSLSLPFDLAAELTVGIHVSCVFTVAVAGQLTSTREESDAGSRGGGGGGRRRWWCEPVHREPARREAVHGRLSNALRLPPPRACRVVGSLSSQLVAEREAVPRVKQRARERTAAGERSYQRARLGPRCTPNACVYVCADERKTKVEAGRRMSGSLPSGAQLLPRHHDHSHSLMTTLSLSRSIHTRTESVKL